MEPTPRDKVENLLAQAWTLVPKSPPAALPPMADFPDVPQWHRFEHSLWALGEKIRQAMNTQPRLRTDKPIYTEILGIVRNRNALRGRQSFVLLFAYKPCATWAGELASLLPDSDIDGQVIYTLYKMKAPGHSACVAPYLSSKITWIRNEAKRYMAFDNSPPAR